MELKPCCGAMSPTWRPIRSGERYCDTLRCESCNHVHATELWWVPLDLPGEDHCVECGGRDRARGGRCTRCDGSRAAVQKRHDDLAALHPTGRYIEAAIAAFDLGRAALALKLATAEVVWGQESVSGRTLRLQALAALGQIERALDEAWTWLRAGAPQPIWGLVAELEAEQGNVPGALEALEAGLQADPGDAAMWLDYGELCNELARYTKALDAASRALADPSQRDRGLALITQIASDYLDAGQPADARNASRYAGDHEVRHVPLAWLRARVAAQDRDTEEALQWLRTVVALDPEHAEARAALEELEPKRKGWLGW